VENLEGTAATLHGCSARKSACGHARLQLHRLPEVLVLRVILLALIFEGPRGARRLVGKILFVCYITLGLAVLDIGRSAGADESQLEPLPARSGTFHRRHMVAFMARKAVMRRLCKPECMIRAGAVG
jgi:hypothetical protein